EPREVPCGTGERHSHFLVDRPDIPVHTEALPVHRANGLERVIERVTIPSKPRGIVLAADGKGDRPGGKIEQVAVNGCVINRQLNFTGVMQSNINSLPGPRAVYVTSASNWVSAEATERIKRRGRICV